MFSSLNWRKQRSEFGKAVLILLLIFRSLSATWLEGLAHVLGVTPVARSEIMKELSPRPLARIVGVLSSSAAWGMTFFLVCLSLFYTKKLFVIPVPKQYFPALKKIQITKGSDLIFTGSIYTRHYVAIAMSYGSVAHRYGNIMLASTNHGTSTLVQ